MSSTAYQRSSGGIPYLLTRKKVKNINLRVQGDGSVRVSASPRVPLAQVDDFVCRHREWIARAQQATQARQQRLLAQPLPEAPQAQEEFARLCRQYYPFFRQALPQGLPRILVKDLTASWGICRPGKGQITFALRLAAQPLAAREYVVVHEYCHFLVPGHGPAFWREVERILPDWKERRALLP